MKIIPWLTNSGLVGLSAILISSGSFAQQEQRLHLKCHLQIEDQRVLIQQFVITDKSKQQFIAKLVGQSVFMADGRSKQEIISVYECTELNARFSSKEAIELEEKTPR